MSTSLRNYFGTPLRLKNETQRASAGSNNLPAWLEIPYGRYPHAEGLQVLDADGAQEMRRAFEKSGASLGHRFRGLPVYIGHPDAEGATPREQEMLQREFPDRRAYGWIREMDATGQALRLKIIWGQRGEEIVASEEFAYFSPHWGMTALADNSAENENLAAWRPVELYSIGLTNQPNIPGLSLRTNEKKSTPTPPITSTLPEINSMSPDLLQLLTLLTGQALPENPTDAELETAAAAALQALQAMQGEMEKEQQRQRDDVLDRAVNSGRISLSARSQWDKNLRNDYEGNRRLLENLPARWGASTQTRTILNSLPARQQNAALSGAAASRAESPGQHVSALTETIERTQRALGPDASFDQAYHAARKAHPELFQNQNQNH